MICYMCGTQADRYRACPRCGANLTVYRQILYSADAYYNQGLERAKVRDLSGAVESLQQALRYNKYHVKARDLLGLVHFEMGDAVSALSEWVIASNLNPNDELAAHYLDEMQNTPGLLDSMDLLARKYNQALTYCRQDSRDLAIIQLKKIISTNKNFVAARQLLALLYIKNGKYNDARKELLAASKLDVRNTLTLRYSKEVKEILRSRKGHRKHKKMEDDISGLRDGDGMRAGFGSKFLDVMDASRSSMLNILFGVLLGLLACFFLVIPTVKQSAKSDASTEVVSLGAELMTARSQISDLENEIQDLQEAIEDYLQQIEELENPVIEEDEELDEEAESEDGEEAEEESLEETEQESLEEAEQEIEQEAEQEIEEEVE